MFWKFLVDYRCSDVHFKLVGLSLTLSLEDFIHHLVKYQVWVISMKCQFDVKYQLTIQHKNLKALKMRKMIERKIFYEPKSMKIDLSKNQTCSNIFRSSIAMSSQDLSGNIRTITSGACFGQSKVWEFCIKFLHL